MMREGYSYDFLKRAIEDAVLSIPSGGYDDETMLYALFFLNVTYIQLEEKQSFDFVLKEHIGKLPLDLSLALRCETKDWKGRNTLIKKQDKFVSRMISGSRGIQAKITQLFEMPVGTVKKGGNA